MTIRQKRIRKLSTHTHGIAAGRAIVPAVDLAGIDSATLQRAGLPAAPSAGDRVLPAVVGKATEFNAEGSYRLDRTRTEPYSRVVQWTRMEFHGRDRVEVTDFVTQTRQRFARVPVPAPAIELEVRVAVDGGVWVATPELANTAANEKALIHQVNMLLELFGECELLDDTLVIPATQRRVNWEMLPQGVLPWPQMQPLLQQRVRGTGSQQAWLQHRLDEVEKYQPTFTAIGVGGMRGYVLFHFANKNLHVLECGKYGNATYVIDGSLPWQDVTKMTKAELLHNNLVRDRIVHHHTAWDLAIRRLLR